MEEYISKTVQIKRSSTDVFNFLSDMTSFSQAIPRDQVEDWHATKDQCTFKVKGVELGLKIVDREPDKAIKYTGDGKTPFDFTLWIQLKEVAPNDTRLRLVLHVKLNMMMKMMLKGKIQNGLDQMADQIASAFNRGTAPEYYTA